MGWIYLALVIVLGTAIWPLARWTLGKHGNARTMGFWVSAATAGVSGMLLVLRGETWNVFPIWVAGAILGLAYAVGFILLIMRCLQIGPAGPTVTINNSAMICGVLFGVIWLDPHLPDLRIITGTVGVLAALAMVGKGNRDNSGDRSGVKDDPRLTFSAEWKRLVLLGGAFSGLSFMSQTYVGLRYPEAAASLLFVFVGFAVSAAILFLSVVRQPRILLRRREWLGGMLLGVINVLGMPLTLAAFPALGSEIVLPVTVMSPMVLILLLGAVVYRERLSRLTWTGCLLAALSVGLIAWGSVR